MLDNGSKSQGEETTEFTSEIRLELRIQMDLLAIMT